MHKRHHRSVYSSYTRSVGVMFVVGLVAVILLRTGGAQTLSVGAEAEAGALAGSASITTQAGSSGGSAVLFNSNGTCSIPSSRPVQDQLNDSDRKFVWPHTTPQEAIVYYNIGSLPTEWADYVKAGTAAWSKSECIDAKTVDSCPGSPSNCVVVSLDTTSDTGGVTGVTDYNANSNGVLSSAPITLNAKAMSSYSPQRKLGTTTHEIGHSLGLRHRATEFVLLYSYNEDARSTVPDDIDFANLLAQYGVASAAPQAVGQPIHEKIVD